MGIRNKIGIITASFLVCAFAFVAIFYFNFGSRIIETNIENDSSIEQRLKLFEYVASASLKDYLWGWPFEDVVADMDYIGIVVIENFWIGFMMLLGLIPLIYFTVFYFLLGKDLFNGYPLYNKLVLFSLFITNASINNSMYSNYAPLMTFLVCIIIFKNDYSNNISSNSLVSTKMDELKIDNINALNH